MLPASSESSAAAAAVVLVAGATDGRVATTDDETAGWAPAVVAIVMKHHGVVVQRLILENGEGFTAGETVFSWFLVAAAHLAHAGVSDYDDADVTAQDLFVRALALTKDNADVAGLRSMIRTCTNKDDQGKLVKMLIAMVTAIARKIEGVAYTAGTTGAGGATHDSFRIAAAPGGPPAKKRAKKRAKV